MVHFLQGEFYIENIPKYMRTVESLWDASPAPRWLSEIAGFVCLLVEMQVS